MPTQLDDIRGTLDALTALTKDQLETKLANLASYQKDHDHLMARYFAILQAALNSLDGPATDAATADIDLEAIK